MFNYVIYFNYKEIRDLRNYNDLIILFKYVINNYFYYI